MMNAILTLAAVAIVLFLSLSYTEVSQDKEGFMNYYVYGPGPWWYGHGPWFWESPWWNRTRPGRWPYWHRRYHPYGYYY